MLVRVQAAVSPPEPTPPAAAVASERPPDAARPRLLLIEDEPGIVDFLRRGLHDAGFVLEATGDGIEGERMALSRSYDVILLDLMLPGRDGLEVLSAIRKARPSVPVIVLSARGELDDRVSGLDAGAVDYLVKPFSLSELAARVRAHLRLLEQAATTTLRGAGIEMNLLTREVSRDGEPVVLSTTEFELLACLLRHHGQVLTREQILTAVWRYEHDPATNVVDVYIGYLRRKLARADGSTPIDTVRSVGYRLGRAG
jgi:DNA-binding response OmpR family regulator